MTQNPTFIMARIGYILLVQCLIFWAILHFYDVEGFIRSDCPFGCECEPDTKTVNCTHGNWDELPSIPAWTEQVYIKGGNFMSLKKPQDCHSYSKVVALELKNNTVRSINSDSLICMPKLQSLTMEFNTITNIANDTFQHVPLLHTISISNMPVVFRPTHFVPSLLTSLSQVEKLTLSNNFLILYDDSINCFKSFRSFSNLTHVDLSGNFVLNMTRQTLEPLKQVSYYISLKKLFIENLTRDLFLKLQLEVLDLSENMIKHIPRYTFSQLPNLKSLDLSGNPLVIQEWFQELPVHTISLCQNELTMLPPITAHMEEVYLGGNNFYHLSPWSFSNLGKLKTIDLSFCNIRIIDEYAFYNLTELKTLNVSFNKITTHSLHTLLQDLSDSQVQTLDLSGNKLRALNRDFEVLEPNQLEILYLRSCYIIIISSKTFVNLGKLHTLDLSYNQLLELDPCVFKGLTKLSFLYLGYNNLQFLNITELQNAPLIELHAQHNKIMFMDSYNSSLLSVLDLSQNDLIGLNLGYSYSLKKLNLSSNSHFHYWKFAYSFFKTWSKLIILDFSGIKHKLSYPKFQLRQLRISGCEISALPSGTFSTLLYLDELDLSSNRIPFINPSAFLNATNLRILDMDNNRITYIIWDSFAHLPNLRFLSIAKNPILCTCQVLWILQAVSTNHLVYMLHKDEILCQGPSDVRYSRVRDLQLKMSDCEDNWLHVLWPLGLGLLSGLVLILLYITWHYRWHIRYAFFLARAGQGRYEELCDGSEYIYDAFVAYSSEDLPWVKEQLMRNIDVNYIGPDGFKLCVHHRDWLVGVDIVENIVKSIAESRRTILVLSKEFAVSRWCQFELAMAHMRLDAEGRKRDRLLVILLNQIPAHLLTPRLIYILTTKSYITWPQEEEQQPVFWKTLLRSLRKELLYTKPAKKDVQEETV